MDAKEMRAALEAEVEWQAKRLEESREQIRNAPIVMAYDNGGGQTGIRKNPMYDAYESLFGTFVKGLNALGIDEADEPEEPKKETVLYAIAGERERKARAAGA